MVDPNFIGPILIAGIGIMVPLIREIMQRRSGQMDALLKYQSITDRQAENADKKNAALYQELEEVIAGAWLLFKQLKRCDIKPQYKPPGVEPDTGPMGKLPR
jgi:hypothetical protein